MYYPIMKKHKQVLINEKNNQYYTYNIEDPSKDIYIKYYNNDDYWFGDNDIFLLKVTITIFTLTMIYSIYS